MYARLVTKYNTRDVKGNYIPIEAAKAWKKELEKKNYNVELEYVDDLSNEKDKEECLNYLKSVNNGIKLLMKSSIEELQKASNNELTQIDLKNISTSIDTETNLINLKF